MAINLLGEPQKNFLFSPPPLCPKKRPPPPTLGAKFFSALSQKKKKKNPILGPFKIFTFFSGFFFYWGGGGGGAGDKFIFLKKKPPPFNSLWGALRKFPTPKFLLKKFFLFGRFKKFFPKKGRFFPKRFWQKCRGGFLFFKNELGRKRLFFFVTQIGIGEKIFF